MIPDTKTAIRILRRQNTPIHIIRHSVQVARVASFLGRHLIATKCRLSMDLLAAGALLHDVAKYRSIVSGGDHAEMGARLLETMGFPGVARIVESHVFLSEELLERGEINEELVVNYADKRVKHTQIVDLDDRFQDLLARYGRDQRSRRNIELLYQQTRRMEQMIFSRLDMEPCEVNETIFRRIGHG